MTSIREAVRRIFGPIEPTPAGVYHFQAPPDSPQPYRLHLRLNPDGSGLLIVNARTILHLNQTAAEYAWHLVAQTPKEKVSRQVSGRYRISPADALADYEDFCARIQSLVTTPDLDPEFNLGFEPASANAAPLNAPLRLDCAITYHLPTGADPKLAPTQRVKQELTTEEWESILENAWQAGIPHVIFTGGEPTLRPDLPALVRKAESLGQVSGLLTDGLRFSDPAYRRELLNTGLDHILFLLEPAKPASWEALQALLDDDIFVAVHLTLTEATAPQARPSLERLAQAGVKTLSLSAIHHDLDSDLKTAEKLAADLGLQLVHDLPVPYGELNPVALELDHVPDGAGRAWLYVEPDGDVLDAQGRPAVRGNLLSDPWDKIWR